VEKTSIQIKLAQFTATNFKNSTVP